MPAIFFYISGHGFGHASRQIEIVNALGRLRTGLDVVIRTSTPSWLFDRTVNSPVTFLGGECDTGVVQIDSLRLDVRTTIDRAAAFYSTLPERAAAEAELLQAHDARLVISDAPPLACAAVARGGIRSVVVSNFTWDWIYAGYEQQLQRAPGLLDTIGAAYREAATAWRLPMHGGFETFRSILDVPFVARHARHDRDDVRRALGLPLEMPLALTSFGGYGIGESYLSRLDCLTDCGVVVTTRREEEGSDDPRGGVFVVPEDTLYGTGFRYEDLVAAVDAVVTKPGYGIIAECIANDTAILYTSRGRFVEYDVLVREMPRFVRSEFIDHESLFAGRWQTHIVRLLASPGPPQRPATDGAHVIAKLIANRL